jgi:hypothetical protein
MGFVAQPLALGQTPASGQKRPLGGSSVTGDPWVARRCLRQLPGERTPDGKPRWLKLVNPTETGIRRHVKIRAEANPFASEWRDYFEDRAFFKKFGIHRREAGLKSSSEPAPR